MNDNMVVEALRYMLAEVEEKLTSVEEENARLKEENERLYLLYQEAVEIIESADTAPLAICEAYMAWKGKKEMNGQYRECPFCDKDGFQEVEEATFKTHTEYRVACANCGAHGPNEISVEQAIKKWNLRRPFDMLQAQLIGLNQRITAFAGQLQAWGYENAARELISEILGGIVDAPDYYTLQDELAKEKARTESLGAVLSQLLHDK